MSLPLRGAWIEMLERAYNETIGNASLPLRGAWIEMWYLQSLHLTTSVAPLAGGVD